jgi:hypothetical protein
MMSFLPIYNTSRTESQKDGYKNDWWFSALNIDSDNIPSWYYETSDTVNNVYLQILDKYQLENGVISVSLSTDLTTGGYTTNTGNGKIYADKQNQTLTEDLIYRLYIDTSGTNLYSDIFIKIS